jgi:hypothetical protein
MFKSIITIITIITFVTLVGCEKETTKQPEMEQKTLKNASTETRIIIKGAMPCGTHGVTNQKGDCITLTAKQRTQGFCLQGETMTCGKHTGMCHIGFKVCSGGKAKSIIGKWNNEVCKGEIQPKKEVCDGRDNDCDGVLDNGLQDCDTKTHVAAIKKAVTAKLAKRSVCIPSSTKGCKIKEDYGHSTCTQNGFWGQCYID